MQTNTLPDGPVLPTRIRALHGMAHEVRTDQSDWDQTWTDGAQRSAGLLSLASSTTLTDTESELVTKALFELSRELPNTKAGRPKNNLDSGVQNTRAQYAKDKKINGYLAKLLRWARRFNSIEELDAAVKANGGSVRRALEAAKNKKTAEIKPTDALFSRRATHLVHIFAEFCAKVRPERLAGCFDNPANIRALRHASQIVIEWLTKFQATLPEDA